MEEPGRKQWRNLNFLRERSLKLKPGVAQLQSRCPTIICQERINFDKNELSTLCFTLSIKHSAKLRTGYGEILSAPLKKKSCFLEVE